MTAPENSSSRLPILFSQDLALPKGSYHLQRSPNTIILTLKAPVSSATANLRFFLQKEGEMLAFLDGASRSDRWNPVPLYVPLMIGSAEYLVATALRNWDILCAERSSVTVQSSNSAAPLKVHLTTHCFSLITIASDSSTTHFVAVCLWLCSPYWISFAYGSKLMPQLRTQDNHSCRTTKCALETWAKL